MRIRALSHSDLADVARIQRECYGHGFIESVDSFAAKLAANAEFSFLATRQNVAVGYVVAFPWAFGEIPALNGLEYSIPPNADSLYIHDIAVVPTARGTGTARLLLDTVLSTARSKGYRRAFLVAVQGGRRVLETPWLRARATRRETGALSRRLRRRRRMHDERRRDRLSPTMRGYAQPRRIARRAIP